MFSYSTVMPCLSCMTTRLVVMGLDQISNTLQGTDLNYIFALSRSFKVILFLY